MKTISTQPKLLCLALASCFPVSVLAAPSAEELMQPESTVSIGVGNVNHDNQRFGSYNGMSKAGSVVTVDADVSKRNEETGEWLRFNARNVGRSDPELNLNYYQPGNANYSVEYLQMQKTAPYDVHTSLGGIGSDSQRYATNATNAQQAPSTASPTELKLMRYRTTLGWSKVLTDDLSLKVQFRSEDKKGNRMFGRGTTTPAFEFLAEPVDTTTRQADVALNYVADRLQLSGGYYGSFFTNDHPQLRISGGATGLSSFSPIALSPDNESHQLFVSGGYDFSKTTRGTFKYSYARALQHDSFILSPVNSSPVALNTNTNDSGRSNLGGRVDNTQLYLSLTSRPSSKTSVLANLRYDDRDDKTAIAQYIYPGPVPGTGAKASTDGFNEPRSITTTAGKLEGSYVNDAGYRFAAGVDYEKKKRSVAGVRVVGYRIETEELTYRAEVKHSFGDTLTGTLATSLANRTGSDWRPLTVLDGTLYAPTTLKGGWLAPIYIADRDRTKTKLMADWAPTDELSAQFAIEDARDTYSGRNTGLDVGARHGSSQLYSVDVSYLINEAWQLSGYASSLSTSIAQATGNALATYWTADLKNSGTNYGLTLKGKVSDRWSVSGDLLWSQDRNKYRLGGAASTSLPDIDSTLTTLKLAGTYTYDKDVSFRLTYINDHRKTNDWTWNGFTYTDGTWLYQKPNETVQFIGFAVAYHFR
jgi:MtrB/PioB family decaheme-associated outer membrane protein